MKIIASTCDGTGTGSGFLLPGGMIATVAHVIAGAVSIAVASGDTTVSAEVVGIATDQDLALLRPARTLSGHTFSFVAADTQVGAQVAALGYPLGEPLTLTTGTISGLNRKIPIDGRTRTDLIQTDVSINPGNSGGPLITSSGTVVGLVDAMRTEAAGIGYAISARSAEAAFAQWEEEPQPQAKGDCTSPLGPETDPDPGIGGPAPGNEVASMANTLSMYFLAINTGDYAAAYAQLDPQTHPTASFEDFAAGVSTSFDFDFQLGQVTVVGPNLADVPLSFTSIQDPSKGPDGEACTNWSLDYTMVLFGDQWLIQSARPAAGSGHTPC